MKLRIFGDRVFFIIVLILVLGGLLMFASASLGLLAREDGAPWRLAFTQLVLGLVPGALALLFFRFVKPSFIQGLALPFYVATVFLTLLVFTPLGETYNGATRWINVGITTLQPSEFLKIGVVVGLSWWLSRAKGQLHDMKKGLVPFLAIVGIPALILLAQPNTSTVIVIGATSLLLYILAGAPWRDILILFLIGTVALVGLVMYRPYVMERVKTFMNPAENALTSGYQIQQSLIAIGSGGLVGKGLGQSVQKYTYLPEAHGDSVFAVYAEEFGFAGSILLVLLFTAFAARGITIAGEAATLFASLSAAGLTLIISISAFLNIGAMLGILPLTGLPLPFISHGGTALFAALASVGIILNVAAYRKKNSR